MAKYALTIFKITTDGKTDYLAVEKHIGEGKGCFWTDPRPVDTFDNFNEIPNVISQFNESVFGQLKEVYFQEVSFKNEADEDDFFEMCGLVP